MSHRSPYLFYTNNKSRLTGRTQNGLFVAIPKQLKAHVTDASAASSRIQAVIIKTIIKNIMIMNAYFPQDHKTGTFYSTDLLTTLADIQNTINEYDFNEFIWTGDIKAYFDRKARFVDFVETYVNDINLIRSWERFDVDFTHAHNSGDIPYTSTIDHFWNSCLDTHVLSAGVLHLPSFNLSLNSPVYCVIQNNKSLLQNQVINIRKPITSWKTSTEKQTNDFYEEIKRKLTCLNVPKGATDCQDGA